MSAVLDLVNMACADGLKFRVEPASGGVKVRGPAPALDAWRPRLRPFKAEIAAALSEKSAVIWLSDGPPLRIVAVERPFTLAEVLDEFGPGGWRATAPVADPITPPAADKALSAALGALIGEPDVAAVLRLVSAPNGWDWAAATTMHRFVQEGGLLFERIGADHAATLADASFDVFAGRLPAAAPPVFPTVLLTRSRALPEMLRVRLATAVVTRLLPAYKAGEICDKQVSRLPAKSA